MRTVELLQLDLKDWERMAGDPIVFATDHQLAPGGTSELLKAVAEQNLALFRRTGVTTRPWTGYLGVDRTAGNAIVGTGGFKAPPDADGVVEIAYFTFPGFETQGVGSAMAAQLVEAASVATGVCRLRAHTLPEKNASTRILEKVGFSRVGEIVDPEDGPIWRWERDPSPAGLISFS